MLIIPFVTFFILNWINASTSPLYSLLDVLSPLFLCFPSPSSPSIYSSSSSHHSFLSLLLTLSISKWIVISHYPTQRLYAWGWDRSLVGMKENLLRWTQRSVFKAWISRKQALLASSSLPFSHILSLLPHTEEENVLSLTVTCYNKSFYHTCKSSGIFLR